MQTRTTTAPRPSLITSLLVAALSCALALGAPRAASAGVSADATLVVQPSTKRKKTAAKPATVTKRTKGKASTASRRTTSKAATRRRTARVVRRPPPPPPLVPTAPRGIDALQMDVASLLAARTTTGRWGAIVVSLSRGDTLFSQGADDPVTPASTMKLFTSALAFDRLGPDHTFSTDVLREGALTADGTLRGNLYLRGDGDPGFSDRFIRGGADAPVDVLAKMIKNAGVTRVDGDVVGDASAFESRRIPTGWSANNLGAYYAAPFSALSLNENLLVVAVAPGRVGKKAAVHIEPASRGLRVVSSVRTVRGTRSRVVIRRLGDREIAVSGTIGSRSGARRWNAVMDDPARFTAGALLSALERAGVSVTGEVRTGAAPRSAAPIASLQSPRLAQLVSVMNHESVNHYAELIYRNAARGRQRQGIGSADAAYDALQQFLRDKVQGDPSAVYATDGSGLSTLDRVTPRAMVQLLRYANEAPWSASFHGSLPVAGQSNMLRHRMRLTAAEGNLRAKTGTLNDVASLAGYVTAVNGELLAFSLTYNGREMWGARESIDAVGATIAAWQR
jgi:serine-type D-Ala-D-Ala carboxypeptidase/endopeptidase (penicillin-binding protein 4)